MRKSGYLPVVMLGLTMICALSFLYWSELSEQVVTTSSSVNGRELPIYSVRTDKPQISLSFDAAWGNDKKWWQNIKRKEIAVVGRRRITPPFFCVNEISRL